MKQVETTLWEPQKIRREFLFGADRTSMEPDDPDATFYEHYACGSPRAYNGYCDPEITKLIEQQSQELDRAKRLVLVQTIQRKLADAAVSPILVLAARLLHHVAVREEPRPAPLALRLGPAAGRLAGSHPHAAPVRIAITRGSATAARALSSASVRLPMGCATTANS